MKKTFHLLVVLVMFSVVLFHGPLVAAASGSLDTAPIKVVVVSGSNHEMGVQYGEQAADLIAANRDTTWNLLDTRVTDGSGMPLGHTVILKDIQVWTYYIEKYNPGLKDWLLGISQGCRNKGFEVSYVDLVAIMVLPQEVWARPQMSYPPETNVTAFVPSKSSTFLAKGRTNTQALSSCTAFAATGSATQGGVPMVSLTLGFFQEIKQYVILVAFPADGERFINLTEAGKVTNNTGMNSKYAWVMTAAVNAPWPPCASSWGLPSEAYHHYLQQYCKSPSEAVEYLNATPKGGVTGIFLFADKSGEVFAYECGYCGCVMREPGDLGEKDFVATTNNYNSAAMIPYNLPADWFPDTYFRYATIFKELSTAPGGTLGFDFAKAAWLSNNWYDAATDTWHTVPVPNDPSDFNTCNVPGNQCEGGESQVVQFPAQKTTHLQSGGPHGTAIQYYWPDDPKPTGEYTKWQLLNSISHMARAASDDALEMIQTARHSFARKAHALDPETQQWLRSLLMEATQAWWEGRMEQKSIERRPSGRNKHRQEEQMARWGAVYTNYATAQLYSQMVTTKLSQY
ncbi:MAG: Acyl-coenzyme A:6-aminopenicillanic acid acyl-transferase [Deltaproteobacteria bacterium]|nr:Acyl-coenzyme A:6-aminopenicillanic acid acyl-transferase [Deltaproteobacteria bacterium]